MRGSNMMEEDMPTEVNKTMTKIGCGASLPYEMIVEVLQWLPVKSVFRFQAVCRSWAALLSSDEFHSLHTAASRAPPKLVYISPTAGFDSTAVYSCPFSSSGRPRYRGNLLFTIDGARGNCLEVVTPASCHGLILLYDAVTTAYYICNAATRAATRLPLSTNDASRSTTGLGFDARTKEYKVVRLINGLCHHKDEIRCEVYTAGSRYGDCWRPVAGGVPADLRPLVCAAVINASMNKLPPVFANGSLHWLLDPTKPGVAVISFSITDETFACIPSPPFWVPGACPASKPWSTAEHLVEMDGQLCLASDLRNKDTLEIWQLRDYSSGHWSLNHRISLSGPLETRLIKPQSARVIGNCGSSSGRKIIIVTCNHKIDNKFEKQVHTYDPKSEALETILSVVETHSSPHYQRPSSRFSLVEETLAPVHKTDEEIASSSARAKATRDILLRLPAKSAMRSKLVCKQWLRLIEKQNFIDSYFEHKNMQDKIKRPKVMLVGKGTGRSGFSFAPLNICLGGSPSHGTLLDRKVVCSKPCHGLNLVSTETANYVCNPCTGFHRSYANGGRKLDLAWRMPSAEEHAFTVGNKNVGLTFDPLIRDHVVVEIFYGLKDFESRMYSLDCVLQWCGSRNMACSNYVPPLPVNDMPPAYLDGMLYWMSEPRLGESHEWAVISFDIITKKFDVIPCPSWFRTWHSRNRCRAFVVELAGALCVVLADPVADSLDVWKLEHGQWGRAYTIHLKEYPDYSVKTNVVVPLAVDPDGGRILLNTGKKIALYDPVEQTIQDLYSLDQVPVVRSKPHTNSVDMPSSSSGNSLTCSKDQPGEVTKIMDTSSMPFVPMLYEESLACYSRVAKLNFLW
jgi:F-box interacting protein